MAILTVNRLKELATKFQKMDEFVDSEGGMISGERNVTNDSEIETGPVQKPYNDDSDYEKGVSTTTDRAIRYTQNIPWFAVYSYAGAANGGQMNTNIIGSDDDLDFAPNMNERKKVIRKKDLEKKIKEDLVKKSSDKEVLDKEPKKEVDKVIDAINDKEFDNAQLEKIKNAILNKLKNA
jgi:hypothetical protein